MSAKKSLFQGESTVKKTIKISVPQLVISLILVAGLFAGGGFWLAKKDSPKSETSQVQKENAEDLTAVYELYQTPDVFTIFDFALYDLFAAPALIRA